MSGSSYQEIISASAEDRRGLFLAAANRLGAPLGNIEKDFWVCWALHQLYHEQPAGGPRLLFKGGTSLSKAYDLIQRFSEDIDVTVFRDDLGEAASVEDLEALSNKKRQAKLDAIRDACAAYISGSLRDHFAERLAAATNGAASVEIDPADRDGQTLLIWYPSLDAVRNDYIKPAVRIESGAKSALDPNRAMTIRPYIAEDVDGLDLAVTGVATIEPERTFWDKVVIAHGLRSWYAKRDELRQAGQRVSRHYYDLHSLFTSPVGQKAVEDAALGADCVRHARMFFNRPDYDLASANKGTFALFPAPGMIKALEQDYEATRAMIFGAAPTLDEILESIRAIELIANDG
jgi:hypothetical protein